MSYRGALFQMLRSQAPGQDITRRASRFFVGHHSLSVCLPIIMSHHRVHGEISQAFPLFLYTVGNQKLDANYYMMYPLELGLCTMFMLINCASMSGWSCSSVSVRALQPTAKCWWTGWQSRKINVWHNDTTILLVQTLVSVKWHSL